MERASIEPASITVSDGQLEDLRERLIRTRWPEKETVHDWAQGAPLSNVRALCDYWRDRYDWRRCETMLNGWSPQRTVIDGVGIHFFHVCSPEANALPVLMTHGWPGSVIEFHKVISALTDPRAEAMSPTRCIWCCLRYPVTGFRKSQPRQVGIWRNLPMCGLN